jgi:hypothetical protein
MPNAGPNPIPETANRGDLLGPPPVIAGEDANEFNELLDRVRADAKPKDMIEEILVRDFVDLVWDIRRLRRLKANLLQANSHEGVGRLLLARADMAGMLEVDEPSRKWAKRQSVKKVEKRLASAGLMIDAVMAETLSVKLDDIERIERMITTAEARLEANLRELDRHRAVLAQALKRATKGAEDAEFEDVAPNGALPKAAA